VTESGFTLVVDGTPRREDVGVLGRGLSAANRLAAGDDGYLPLAVFLRDASGSIGGGVYGGTYWGWFHVEVLWVRQDLRKAGHGSRLLAAAEREAVRRGCTRVFLDTFDFQASDFYARRGYEVFGELSDFPPGHRRLWLVKQLER
jgi:GNAT superfamily N-acetyltransferase